MMRRLLTAAALITLATAAHAQAQDITERTELLQLEGRRGPSLLRPGFAVGEYEGVASTRASSTRILGRSIRSDESRTEFTVSAPALGGEVSASCAGGESRTGLGWITFDREELAYTCDYGGAAPAGAGMTLALARGSWLARAQQALRAGEFTWGEATYRFETRRLGGLPLGRGGPLGYIVTRDGEEVGGLALNAMRPTFYLPPQGSPDRDAVAVLTLSLFHFQDPANNE